MRLTRAAFSFSVVLAACGLFPDVSSLGGPGSDASAPEVGAGDADAGDAGPCASQHVFCDDFDDGPLGAKWDSPYKTDGGGLALTTLHAVSPPNALAATLAGTGPGVEGESELQKSLPAADHTRVQADVTVAPGTSANEVDLVAMVSVTAPSGFDHAEVNVQSTSDGGILEEYLHGPDGGAGQDLPVTTSFATTRHIQIDVDFPSQTFALTIDGVPAAGATLSPQITKSALTLNVGVAYIEGSTGTWTVFVDDVVVDQW